MQSHFYPRQIFRIQFCVENSKSDKTVCEKCLKRLQKGEIRIVHYRVMAKSDYFHLNCYNPKFKQFILLEHISFELDKESRVIFDNWLTAWNANYFPLDQRHYCPILPNQQKFEVQVKNRRPLLEVFKFLEVIEVVRSFSNISKNFYTLIWEKELWHFFLARDFNLFTQDSSVNQLKATYLTCFFNNCIECKQKPSNQSFNRCPLLKKTLCLECLKMDKFSLTNKTEILRVYEINSDLIKVPWWTDDGKNRVTYKFLFEDKLMEFRKKQKGKVVEFLKNFCTNSTTISSFELLDVTMMDLKVDDSMYHGLQVWRPNYQMVVKGSLFEKMFQFIRKGKEVEFNRFIGNKQLK